LNEVSGSQRQIMMSDIEILRELKLLHNEGVISDDEFEVKKRAILDRL
jgi:hypothetical protein